MRVSRPNSRAKMPAARDHLHVTIHEPYIRRIGRTGVDLFRRHKLPLPPTAVTTISIYMRLNSLASSRFITLLPMQILRHRSSSAWLRALNVDLGDTSAPIASITLKGRRAGGAVKLFQHASRDVCKAMVGLS